jgi:DNA repair ATPase RecN
VSDEIDEKWWDLFKGNEKREETTSDSPTAEAHHLLTTFETDLKRFDRAKKELTKSISTIVPALEEERKTLRDEIQAKSRRVEEIEDQIKAVQKWMKKHRDLLTDTELQDQF